MEHDRYQGELREYISWLDGMRKNPPWAGKKETATEKVQGVTHPIGEELAGAYLEQAFKDSNSHLLKTIGKVLKRSGPVLDVLGSPKDAW